MRKFIIFVLILIVFLFAVGYVTYLFRFDIFQYSAESLIMKNLPDQMRIDDIYFDIKKGILEIRGFRILNPSGYSDTYFCNIGRVICHYENRGERIQDGIIVKDITAEEPVFYLERKINGENNFQQLQAGLKNQNNIVNVKRESDIPETKAVKGPYAAEAVSKNKIVQGNFITDKISQSISEFNVFDFIDLTDTINVEKGAFFITDNMFSPPYKVSLEDVNGTIRLVFNDDYTRLIELDTKGAGIVNGYRDQKVTWDTKVYPSSSGLSMSNNFQIDNIDIRQFKPYYDHYLPIDIVNARANGDFVINFDNNNIGSINTLRLQDLRFLIKKDTSSSRYWEGAFSEIIRYLTSSKGETIFDFKIKGSMDNPTFYPGPYVKAAIQSMVVDKISEAVQSIQDKSKEQTNAAETSTTGVSQPPRKKTDAEKVVDIINIFLDEY